MLVVAKVQPVTAPPTTLSSKPPFSRESAALIAGSSPPTLGSSGVVVSGVVVSGGVFSSAFAKTSSGGINIFGIV